MVESWRNRLLIYVGLGFGGLGVLLSLGGFSTGYLDLARSLITLVASAVIFGASYLALSGRLIRGNYPPKPEEIEDIVADVRTRSAARYEKAISNLSQPQEQVTSTDQRSGPIIEAENLTKIYNGKIKAVDHISFQVEQGEIFGFLGPNGAGKTTTIKMLTTLASVTDGSAKVGGFDVVHQQDEVRRSIGIVPQDLTVDDDLSGMENIMLQAKLYHVPTEIARERAKELLGLVELTDAADRQVSTYSGGMRKRLELIVGLIHEPKMLFLDEPTLGLDIQTRSVMWNYIRRLNKERGMTLFTTTHYLEEADSICDRIAIIDHGQIKVIGAPSELKQKLGGDLLEITVSDGVNVNLIDFFRSIPGVKDVKKRDSTYRVKLPSAEAALPDIFEGIAKQGLKVKNIAFTKPTLDQVYIEVTGRSLRDAEEGAEDAIKNRFITMRRSQ